jgi:hypothetical protein
MTSSLIVQELNQACEGRKYKLQSDQAVRMGVENYDSN